MEREKSGRLSPRFSKIQRRVGRSGPFDGGIASPGNGLDQYPGRERTGRTRSEGCVRRERNDRVRHIVSQGMEREQEIHDLSSIRLVRD